MVTMAQTKAAFMLRALLFTSLVYLSAATCDDNPIFLFDGVTGKDCNWARKNPTDRCHFVDPITLQIVHEFCPITCGTCPRKRNGSLSTCADDDAFRFKDTPKKSCKWVGRKKTKRKRKLCRKTPIRTSCPVTCGTCDTTTAPTRSQTDSPTKNGRPSEIPTPPPTSLPTRKPTPPPTSLPTRKPITPTRNPTPWPTKIPTKPPSPLTSNMCGCSTCTNSVLNTYAGDYTCGARIDWLQKAQGYSERDACAKVAGEEFPQECDGCNPYSCNGDPNDDVTNDDVPPSPGTQKCGGAVNSSNDANRLCQTDLWTPTGDSTMHCFAYGGSGDPCHLNNNNDPSDGIYKDPSKCRLGDTFYLWDEPDTQGKSYAWAGKAWYDYSRRFATQLGALRARGVKVTSPLVTAGGPGVLAGRLREFMNACGSACSNPGDPAYIDVIALNAFCGDFNGPAGCRGGAEFIANEALKMSQGNGNRPVYVTNWSRLGTGDSNQQKGAMDAIDAFFTNTGGVIQRVYWFGAKDFGGGSSNNYLTNTFSDGTTLGQYWATKCASLG